MRVRLCLLVCYKKYTYIDYMCLKLQILPRLLILLLIQLKNKIKLYMYNINNIIVKLQTTVLQIIPSPPYMLQWFWNGGATLIPAKKMSKQVHGIIFILQKKGMGIGVTAIAALWMMDLAVVVMRWNNRLLTLCYDKESQVVSIESQALSI